MKVQILLLSFPISTLLTNISAQPKFEIPNIQETALDGFATVDQNSGWLYFTENSKITVENFFSDYKNTFSLSSDDIMQLEKKQEDPDLAGYTHYQYKQFYKNIEVEKSDFILHTKDNYIYVASGKTVSGINFDIADTVSETDALGVALADINATLYAWQDIDWENEIKSNANDENASSYPTGKLKITQLQSDNWSKENYKLAYYFEIKTLVPFDLYGVYIDALTGEFLKKLSLIDEDVCTLGTVNTVYDGNNISFTTMYRLSYNDYILQDECRGGTFTVKNYTGLPWAVLPKIYQATNVWGYANAQATCLWAIEKSWDYYHYIHNRNGISDGNRDIHIWYQTNFNNAAYDYSAFYDEITVGPTFESLDVLGHEFTHGVTYFTSGLGGGNTEAGALNESYSDIFGVLIEDYVKGGLDWAYGNSYGSTHYRNLDDPFTSYTPQPKIYYGTYWDSNGEKHTNDGVNNYWFYLLTEGGARVVGIGKVKARFIAYKTLTQYLGSNATYADARAATRQAAIDNYGECSNEVAQVCAAWDAVNVSGAGYTYCCAIAGATVLCDDGSDLPFTYTVLTRSDISYSWTIPSGWSPSSNASTNSSYTLNSFSSTTPKTIQVTVTRSGSSATCSLTTSFINCDGENCPPYCREENDLDNEISLFPIPANNFVTLQTSWEFLGAKAQIIDALGIVRHEFILSSVDSHIDILGLKPGFYFVAIASKHSRKLIPFTIQ